MLGLKLFSSDEEVGRLAEAARKLGDYHVSPRGTVSRDPKAIAQSEKFREGLAEAIRCMEKP
jgi:hypothetical protein